MPATTPTYGLPYQVRTDPPDGAQLGDGLAHGIEDELARVDTDLSTLRGDIGTADGRIRGGLTRFPLWRGQASTDRNMTSGGINRSPTMDQTIVHGDWTGGGASWNPMIPTTGIYLVTAVARFNGTLNSGVISMTLRQNETDPINPTSATAIGFTTDSTRGDNRPTTLTARAVRQFTAGDTIMFGIAQTTGSGVLLRRHHTYLEVEYLRA